MVWKEEGEGRLLPPAHRTLLTQYCASGRSARRAQKAYADNEENVIATLSTAFPWCINGAVYPSSLASISRLVARFYYYAYDA